MPSKPCSFVPKRGNTLRVLNIARISGLNQDERSNSDQDAYCRRHLEGEYSGPAEFTVIKGQGSGEYLDRRELLKAEELIQSGNFDLVICEDIGRIMRRMHAYLFCEMCEDNDTRLIAINDHIDTSRDDWRLNAFFASFKHEMSNKDTSSRIRRTLRNRFDQYGGSLSTYMIYGIIRPPGAKSDADLRKDPDATPIYDEWFRRLENGAFFTEVADWLNSKNVPTGPDCKKKYWTGKSVRVTTRNTLLKGERRRGKTTTRRINKTGRRKAVPGRPEDLQVRMCPHLAHIDPGRYDRLILILQQRFANRREKGERTKANKNSLPRKRTDFPGQHLRCGICSRKLYWGANGTENGMACSGLENYRCWNGFTVDGSLAAERIASAVFNEIQLLPDFEPAFLAQLTLKLAASSNSQKMLIDRSEAQLRSLASDIRNITDALARVGYSEALADKLGALEKEKAEIELSLRIEKLNTKRQLVIPSMAELKKMALEANATLTKGSPEFARLMLRLIPEMKAYPYRLLDGNSFGTRIHMAFDLSAFIQEDCHAEDTIRHELIVDLCKPPPREILRPQIMALLKDGLSRQEVCNRLGCNECMVDRAKKMQRIMDQLSVTDPYVILTEPPAEYGTLKRHLHPRYRFQPLDDSSAA